MTHARVVRRSRRSVALRIVALIVVLVTAVVALWWFTWVPNRRPGLAANEVYGIDVSHHQGRIDWREVADDDIDFAYIKASEGTDFTDARFDENWRAAGAAGVRRGAYHFFSLCGSGAEQAVYFLGTAPPVPGALPPAVDLELAGNCARRPDSAVVFAELQAFLSAVEKAWQSRVLIYVGDDWDSRYPVLDRLDRPRWVASFLGQPEDRWTVWQLHGFARVNGINRRVDLDVGRLNDLDTVQADAQP